MWTYLEALVDVLAQLPPIDLIPLWPIHRVVAERTHHLLPFMRIQSLARLVSPELELLWLDDLL